MCSMLPFLCVSWQCVQCFHLYFVLQVWDQPFGLGLFFGSGSSQVAKFRDCLLVFISRAQLGVADGRAACDKAGWCLLGCFWVQTQRYRGWCLCRHLVVSCDSHMKASLAATMCMLVPVPVNSSFRQLLPPAMTSKAASVPVLLSSWGCWLDEWEIPCSPMELSIWWVSSCSASSAHFFLSHQVTDCVPQLVSRGPLEYNAPDPHSGYSRAPNIHSICSWSWSHGAAVHEVAAAGTVDSKVL